MMVSFSVSPFEELVVLASENPMTFPPNRLTAVSKLSRVRVEGSKNRVATTLPSRIYRLGFSSNRRAFSRRSRISSFEKSVIDTKLSRFIVGMICFYITMLVNKKANTTIKVILAFYFVSLQENIFLGFYKNACAVMDYMFVLAHSFH